MKTEDFWGVDEKKIKIKKSAPRYDFRADLID